MKYRGDGLNTVLNKNFDKSNNVSIKTLSSYAAGSLGNNIIFSLINSYLLIFYTNY